MATAYPFPDNVHVSSSVTLKLNDNNYLLWKTQFESLLSSQKLIGFVNGAVSVPAQTRRVTNGDVTTEVRSWLFGTLSEEVLGHVHSLETSHQIWVSLAENFNKSSVAREFSLRRNLQLVSKKGKTFSAREFKTICDSLSSIRKPVDESMKIFGFLNGLGREYDPIATVIQSSLSKLPPPTFNDVISEVQGFDSKLHLLRIIKVVVVASVRTKAEEAIQHEVGFTQHQSSPHVQGERPICQICGRIGHTALKCYNRFDNNYQSDVPTQAFASLRVSEENGREWHPDSAAIAHITSSTSGLQGTTTYKGNDTVMVGDGAYLPITHVGSTTISSSKGTIPINEVLVCPDIKKSLLSVSKLCDDYPCGVFFDSNKVYIIDLNTQKVVSNGPRKEGLYVLQNQEIVACFSNRRCAASLETWHHRLGHSNSRSLQHLLACKEIQINKSRTSPVW
ncbi:PREDICTED: uncharacterized protein LOC109125425 [Camelina sativa]|uniref:Uncharacterized protein LOC109125425 n=1 Tax=Camelina sativa TaxID=90675 RepID=A0ABM1Q752_CAMSA|nr:PREDICTED: uncharacterized protein LOC109125425 [Camelina sativa]